MGFCNDVTPVCEPCTEIALGACGDPATVTGLTPSTTYCPLNNIFKSHSALFSFADSELQLVVQAHGLALIYLPTAL